MIAMTMFTSDVLLEDGGGAGVREERGEDTGEEDTGEPSLISWTNQR